MPKTTDTRPLVERLQKRVLKLHGGNAEPVNQIASGYLAESDSALHQQAIEEISRLIAANGRLRGLEPDLPPRPPEGYGLPRFGLRWNGPGIPLAVPFDDGYWTPWHLADQFKAENEALRKDLADWQEIVAAIKRETPDGFKMLNRGNAPGHGHSIPGVWDGDNGAMAGKECAWCRVWNAAMSKSP